MGISAKWLKSLVGLRKVERRRQQQQRKEDADVGVGPRRLVHTGFLPIIMQFLHILFLNLWLVHSFCLLPRPMWIMRESFFLFKQAS
jgi:hypothetical protein